MFEYIYIRAQSITSVAWRKLQIIILRKIICCSCCSLQCTFQLVLFPQNKFDAYPSTNSCVTLNFTLKTLGFEVPSPLELSFHGLSRVASKILGRKLALQALT